MAGSFMPVIRMEEIRRFSDCPVYAGMGRPYDRSGLLAIRQPRVCGEHGGM